MSRVCLCDKYTPGSKYTKDQCYKCWWWHERRLKVKFARESRYFVVVGAFVSGPGTELTTLLETLNVTPSSKCNCKRRAAQMDRWGVAGCRANTKHIIAGLKEAFGELGLWDKIKLGKVAMSQPWFSPLHPFTSTLDEALRLAAENESLAGMRFVA